MKAVWVVRSRQLLRRVRYWVAIVGYDPGDRSIGHRIYLVYVIIFFGLWSFAVLALLADQVAEIYNWLDVVSPIRSGITLLTVILVTDFIFQCHRYSKRCPFVFSDEDAALICLTPVDRRQVALAWLVGEWIPAGLPYWAGAVTLTFSFPPPSFPAGLDATYLPYYLLSGFRAISIMVPLHMGLMSLTYFVGALRLRGDKDLPHLRLIPIGIGVALLLLVMYSPALLSIVLAPVIYALEAGFGIRNWLEGFAPAFLLALFGLIVLYMVTPQLNLSRASQESQLPREFKHTWTVGGHS